MTKRSLVLAFGLVAALIASQAQAGSITTLYSTGVDASHALLAAGAADPHYVLTASADPTVPVGTHPTVAFGGGFPFPPWVPNTATAQWDNPKTNEDVNGAYNYTTTFTIGAGSDPKTAVITGSYSADDTIVGVLLNGVLIPGLSTPDHGYSALYPFTISSGFIAGLNTLTFETLNTAHVVQGLIVDMTGTVSTVPEPASMALLGIGLSGLFAFRRFRGRASVA